MRFQADKLVSFRLSPEEAIFLAHATDNVRFYYETVGLLSLEVNLMQFSALVARAQNVQGRPERT